MGLHSTRSITADLYAARVERAKANNLPCVRAAKVALEEVQGDISETRIEISRLWRKARGAEKHATGHFNCGKHVKAWSKVDLRDRAREDIREAKAELAKFLEKEVELKKQLENVRASVGLPQIDDRYYSLRHQVMVELYESELGDTAALERKQTYMKFAGIPTGVSPDKVLYYERGGDIHLFHGGRKPYRGEGNFADGVGHGHVVLVPGVNGSYVARFTRPPGR